MNLTLRAKMKILTRKRPKYKQSQTLRVKTQKCTLILISQNKDYMEGKKKNGGGGSVGPNLPNSMILAIKAIRKALYMPWHTIYFLNIWNISQPYENIFFW